MNAFLHKWSTALTLQKNGVGAWWGQSKVHNLNYDKFTFKLWQNVTYYYPRIAAQNHTQNTRFIKQQKIIRI